MRYLCLTSQSQMLTDVDTWWTRMVGNREMWGYDFPGWDCSLDIDANLQRRYGQLTDFDAVFLSFSFTFGDPLGQQFAPPSAPYLGRKPAVAFVHEHLDITAFEVDCQRFPYFYVPDVDVLLHPYAEAEMDVHLKDRWHAQRDHTRRGRQVIAHVPHHVRTDIFAPPHSEDERDIDFLLVGRLAYRPLYELRERWAAIIARGDLPGARHVDAAYGWTVEWTPALLKRQETDFANLLRRARIVLTCSSWYRYMLQKYTEIASCDAFILGDAPVGLPDAFSDNMGLVSAQMTDEQLVSVAKGWLADDVGRRERTARLGTCVRSTLNMDHFWESVDQAVRLWVSKSQCP